MNKGAEIALGQLGVAELIQLGRLLRVDCPFLPGLLLDYFQELILGGGCRSNGEILVGRLLRVCQDCGHCPSNEWQVGGKEAGVSGVYPVKGFGCLVKSETSYSKALHASALLATGKNANGTLRAALLVWAFHVTYPVKEGPSRDTSPCETGVLTGSLNEVVEGFDLTAQDGLEAWVLDGARVDAKLGGDEALDTRGDSRIYDGDLAADSDRGCGGDDGVLASQRGLERVNRRVVDLLDRDALREGASCGRLARQGRDIEAGG
jgi:hypothetical protein